MVYNTSFLAGISAVLLLLGACASDSVGQMTSTTSSPRSVDAQQDNAAVLEQASPGIVIKLQIEGNEVRSFEVQIAGISGNSTGGHSDEVVGVKGMSGGATVASMSIADQRVNAAEDVGIVMNENRTLIGMLVLPARIDSLEVTISGAERAQELDVRGIFDEYCERYATQPICSRKKQ